MAELCEDDLTPEECRQLDAPCDDFDLAWQRGDRPRPEDHLAAVAANLRPLLLGELVRIELEWRFRRNEEPTEEEYAQRFPQLAAGAGGCLTQARETVARLAAFAPPTAWPETRLTDGPQFPTQPSPGEGQESSAAQAAMGEYDLVGRLGGGGMGDVYRARHRKLGTTVALKVLTNRRAASPEATDRFLREMAALGQLEHPNVVEALYAGEHDAAVYLVMKLIAGADLHKLVQQRGPLPVAEACELVRQAALGLAYLHERGLVHRDIKPSNLIRSADGAVKILDLGLVLLPREKSGERWETQVGSVLGTLDYLPPEQARDAGNVDGRADLYSLGATLFFLLVGKPPFAHHDGLLAKLRAHEEEAPADLRSHRPDVPEPLAVLVGKLLAKRPEDRPAAAAIVQVLAGYAAGGTVRGGPEPENTSPPAPLDEQAAPGESTAGKAEATATWSSTEPVSRETPDAVRNRRPRWPWVAAAAVVMLAGGLVWKLAWPGPSPSASALVSAPPLAEEPLKGFIDVVVVQPDNPRRQYVWLSDPASRPLRKGDVVFVRAELNRPAYCYVVWIDTEGAVQPIYPWIKGDWKHRRDEKPVRELKLPDLKVDNQWAIEAGPAGMETLVLLTRATPLPEEVDLAGLLGKLGTQTLPAGDAARMVAWFENGVPVQEKDRTVYLGKRKLALDRESTEPVLRTQARIQQRLGDLFGYTRAAAFPNIGGK